MPDDLLGDAAEDQVAQTGSAMGRDGDHRDVIALGKLGDRLRGALSVDHLVLEVDLVPSSAASAVSFSLA